MSSSLAAFTAAFALTGFVACAPSRPAVVATNTTSATIPPAPAGEVEAAPPEPPAEPVAEMPAQPEPEPPGQLVCRTKVDGNTVQLFLDWDKQIAKGLLRTDTPSGITYRKVVKAERYKDSIVVDDPEPVDLAAHVGMIVERAGTKLLQLGDDYSHTWWSCE